MSIHVAFNQPFIPPKNWWTPWTPNWTPGGLPQEDTTKMHYLDLRMRLEDKECPDLRFEDPLEMFFLIFFCGDIAEDTYPLVMTTLGKP